VQQYFGILVPVCIKTWSAMKLIASVVGLLIVLAAHALLR
jgi:H+/gluconate symporter-like permease